MTKNFDFAIDHLLFSVSALYEKVFTLVENLEIYDDWELEIEFASKKEANKFDNSVWEYIRSHTTYTKNVRDAVVTKKFGYLLEQEPLVDKWLDLIDSIINTLADKKVTNELLLTSLDDTASDLEDYVQQLYASRNGRNLNIDG